MKRSDRIANIDGINKRRIQIYPLKLSDRHRQIRHIRFLRKELHGLDVHRSASSHQRRGLIDIGGTRTPAPRARSSCTIPPRQPQEMSRAVLSKTIVTV